MQFKKLKNLIAILFTAFAIFSCTSDYIVPEPPALPEPPNNDSIPNDTIPENLISFSGQIQPIFTAKCMPCHAVGAASPTLAAGKSYQSLMNTPGMIDTINPGNSALYLSMKTGGSMSQYCKKANADSVYKWIRQGAKNN